MRGRGQSRILLRDNRVPQKTGKRRPHEDPLHDITMNDRIHASAGHEDLLGRLYDAALSPHGFQDFIEALCDRFQLKAAAMGTRHIDTQEVKALWLQGISSKWMEKYALNRAGEDLLSKLLMCSPSGVFYAPHLDTPNPELISETPFYREWAQPQGIAYAAGAIIVREGAWLTQIILLRSTHQPPFAREELDKLNQLVPHLRRATLMRERFASLQLRQRFLTSGSDILAIPTLLFDEWGRVMHTNRRANALLREHGDVWMEGGHVFTSDAATTRRFNLELTVAIRASHGNGPGHKNVVLLPRTGRMPLMLMIMPLPLNDGVKSHGAALSFFFDPETTTKMTPALIQRLFQLSEAEAELAVALCSGKTLGKAASERGTSIHTIRSQLKSIFLKTGTKRQTDLVSLLLASPAYFLAQSGAD